jgi:hypothetical protein
MAFIVAASILGGIAVAGGATSAIMAGKARKEAAAKAQDEKVRMDQLKAQYASLDTSNPFLNQENKFEDLTVNQQQAQFQAQQFQQSQANILDSLRGAAGGSGIAALAQQLAQQGDIAAQRASATIGQQEAANQRMAAQEAARLQTAERQGELISRNLERDQIGTLLGMSQNTYAAYAQAETAAQQAQIDAISGIASDAGSIANLAIQGQG